MSPKSPTDSRGLAMMPDYSNRAGSATNVPDRRQPSPGTRSGKAPEGPGRPLVVKPGSRIVVKNGRLTLVERGPNRRTLSDSRDP